ncbi:MAG: MBL fold metallo-hydrolase [Gammaproteobacteria bacterium]|nr:MAG: MBL fold metallo-hydrolase [Gammaproteobacteria bacterium]
MGNGVWAYLQPNGSWGWSNAGLVTDSGASLLVDTLFDERLTAKMLADMQAAAGVRANDIATVVNTHANGDHTYGNRLVANAEIIASEAGAAEMEHVPPAVLATMLRQASDADRLGRYLKHCFAAFDFEGLGITLPTRTFRGELQLKVGSKAVELIEVGPAHTGGDILVHVPADRVIYTGDILFIGGTPIIWAGPVGNWIRACDRILQMDLDVIVPGHGPVTDKAGVREVREYLRFVDAEARPRFDAGMGFEEAARDIALGRYRNWLDYERIVVNVYSLYQEYAGVRQPPDHARLFDAMAAYLEAQP